MYEVNKYSFLTYYYHLYFFLLKTRPTKAKMLRAYENHDATLGGPVTSKEHLGQVEPGSPNL